MKHTPDLSHAAWRKSSYSDGGANNCVEIAQGVPGATPVRDSKLTAGPVLVFGTSAWSAFLEGAARRHS
ncbi:DUF397 domain-containing protein [Streptomyces ziwulingensis]|uniref:DUF397 domain-containing protein n=1 Tax=Streptomyces ziwulingensis TaxID=1045501 RepID=A0ABP9AZX5_9ACTN